MQVKKFEAKTMKEALQLVKQELGPEAIILSAKDNKKSFGLAGRGSIEITAAISEKSLQKRQYAESHLADNAKDRFRSQSAKNQKAFIDNSMVKFQQRRTAADGSAPIPGRRASVPDSSNGLGAIARRPVTNRRYIDIDDEDGPSMQPSVQTQALVHDQPVKGRRVDDVLEEFGKTGKYVLEDSANRAMARVDAHQNQEVVSLRQEVDALRDILSQFQRSGGKNPVTQHPGADYGLPFELSSNFEKLQNAGVDTRYIVEILEKANDELTPLEKKKKSLVDAWVARYILSHTHVSSAWLKPGQPGQVHLFVGPSGHGKTSAVVKMASQLVLQDKKKIAIFTCDTFKVGAADQLKIYSQILNLPFETIKHTIEFSALLKKYSDFDAILVDYPGFSLKDIQEIDQIRALIPQREIPKMTHLILSCASKDLDAYETCHRYQITHFDDIIVTKIDESFAHGFLYNIQRKTEKPLYAFCIGQKIPEDIEFATRERVLDLIYKITKNNK